MGCTSCACASTAMTARRSCGPSCSVTNSSACLKLASTSALVLRFTTTTRSIGVLGMGKSSGACGGFAREEKKKRQRAPLDWCTLSEMTACRGDERRHSMYCRSVAMDTSSGCSDCFCSSLDSSSSPRPSSRALLAVGGGVASRSGAATAAGAAEARTGAGGATAAGAAAGRGGGCGAAAGALSAFSAGTSHNKAAHRGVAWRSQLAHGVGLCTSNETCREGEAANLQGDRCVALVRVTKKTTKRTTSNRHTCCCCCCCCNTG